MREGKIMRIISYGIRVIQKIFPRRWYLGDIGENYKKKDFIPINNGT